MYEDPVIEVFSGSLWEAELLKTILEDNGIGCFLKNSTLQTFLYEPVFSAGVKVMVLESDHVRATSIVDEFWKNIKKDSI
jgi:hypothetical protein